MRDLIFKVMMYIVLLLLAISVILTAYTDAYKDNTGKRNHVSKLLASIFLASGSFMSGFLLGEVYEWSNSELYWKIFLVLSAYILIRTGLFNISYNQFRELPIGYLGKTDDVFDKWINKLPEPLIITIYVSAIFFSTVLINYI